AAKIKKGDNVVVLTG
nr:RecName: Full=Large ribosomal subunit protein uL24; AltName: Full=50S ribosomal protein L24 [Brevundimonas diminuta]AAB34180.1 ribosomal protein L24 {N-terminal} [Brevundimonas diminuta, Peptide Partial, 15 aa] [Brevundimonas diminuta]